MVNEDKILQALDNKKNVLLVGATGTGKSRLMNKVAELFSNKKSSATPPTRVPGETVPIPALKENSNLDVSFLSKKNRKVFRTTLHQNSKYRDFLTGIIPKIGSENGFCITKGILYRANEFAKQKNSAALLIIDELNRGPAVEVFGGSIVAIESDKRLAENNENLPTTQYFEILSPKTGEMIPYSLSPNLYILAAMNQADVSVAPLDVAFLRRWLSIKLKPDYQILEDHFLRNNNLKDESQKAYEIAFKALKNINRKIEIGRGEEYEVGQGVFLSTEMRNNTYKATLTFLVECWQMIYAHIEEIFFGDSQALAFLVNADEKDSPYTLKEEFFAGQNKQILRHDLINENNILDVYKTVAMDYEI